MGWPGVSRRRANQQAPRATLFESLLDEALGSGIGAVLEAGKRMAPKCAMCGAPTVLICKACNRPACQSHVFVQAQELSWQNISVTAVCAQCMSQSFPFVRIHPPHHLKDLLVEWHHQKFPWEILGVPWNADEELVNTQYKALALKLHPDKGGSTEAMSHLSSARQWMIAHQERRTACR